MLTAGCGQRVQPAAAGGPAEREAVGGGDDSQPRGQVGRHRGLPAAEGPRSGDRQGRADRTEDRARLAQDNDPERRGSVCTYSPAAAYVSE